MLKKFFGSEGGICGLFVSPSPCFGVCACRLVCFDSPFPPPSSCLRRVDCCVGCGFGFIFVLVVVGSALLKIMSKCFLLCVFLFCSCAPAPFLKRCRKWLDWRCARWATLLLPTCLETWRWKWTSTSRRGPALAPGRRPPCAR